MATKNLVPRGDLEGKLGIQDRRWKEVNAEIGDFTTLRIDALKNRNDHDLLVSSDLSVTIERVGPGLTNDEGEGFQYNLTTSGGSGSSNNIFEGTSPDQNMVKTIRSGGESKILFTIGGTPDTGWEIDGTGNMLPYADDSNNIGNINKQVKEVFLMPDALTFANGKINVSTSKRLQFGIPSGNSHIYDDISLTKSSVKVATTSSLEFAGFVYDNSASTLTAPSAGIISSVDDKSLSVNDRILVKSRTNKEENGIYVVTNSGSTADSVVLTRAADLNKDKNFIGISVSVLEGTDNKQKLFFVTPPASGGSTVGTNHQNWMTFGEGLDVAGVRSTVGSMFESGVGISFNFDTGTGKLTPALSLALNDLSDVNVGTTLGVNDNNKVLQWNWDVNTNTGEFGLATVTSGGTPRTDEEIQDVVSTLIADGTHTGITFVYDDSLNKLSASVTDSDNFVKKNETTTFGSNSGTQPTYDFNANSVTVKVPTPTANEHAVNKQYVDTAMQGIDEVLTPVKAASTGNVVLADLINGYSSIDGIVITLNTGDRVLLKDQTTASENGVYVVGVTGVGGGNTPTVRATDLAAGAQANAVFIFVEEGTQNANSGFICTSPTTNDTVGTDDLTFVKFSSAGQINAGNALTLTGQDLHVDVDGSTIQIASDQLQVGTIGFGNISGDLPTDKLPSNVLTTSSTITANSITAAGITGIHTMSGSITKLQDTDAFIINDASHTDANSNVTTDQVKQGLAARILEYVGERFDGDITVTNYSESAAPYLEKLKAELNTAAFTLKNALSVTNTDSTSSTYDDDNKLQPDDLFLISDNSDSDAIKKVKFSDISAASLDILGLEDTNNNTAPFTSDDYLPIYERTSESNRKITVNKLISTLGVRPLAFKHVETSDAASIAIVTNSHYNIKEAIQGSIAYNFYFYDDITSPYKQFNGNDGDIVKITLTAYDSEYLSETPSLTANTTGKRTNTRSATRVNVRLNKDESILYNARDLSNPIEFIYTVNYDSTGNPIADSGEWRPYVRNPDSVPYWTHIHTSTQLNGFLGSSSNFMSADDVYIAMTNVEEMELNLPKAETAYGWGMKHGETKTFHFMASKTRKITFKTVNNDIAKLSSRGTNDSTYLDARVNSKTLLFGTDTGHIRKVKVKLHTFLGQAGLSNNKKGIRYYFWDIDGIDTINILPDTAQDKHLLMAQTASPAAITSGFLKDENIDNDADISFSKLDKIVTANRLLGSTTADTTVSEVQVETGMIKDLAVTKAKLEKVSANRVLGYVGTLTNAQNVSEVSVLDDISSEPSNKHTNLATVQSIREHISTSLTSLNITQSTQNSNTYESSVASPIVQLVAGDMNTTALVNLNKTTYTASTDYNQAVFGSRYPKSYRDYDTDNYVHKIYLPEASAARAESGLGSLIKIQVKTTTHNRSGGLFMGYIFLPHPNDNKYGNPGNITKSQSFPQCTFISKKTNETLASYDKDNYYAATSFGSRFIGNSTVYTFELTRNAFTSVTDVYNDNWSNNASASIIDQVDAYVWQIISISTTQEN